MRAADGDVTLPPTRVDKGVASHVFTSLSLSPAITLSNFIFFFARHVRNDGVCRVGREEGREGGREGGVTVVDKKR